MQNQAHKILFSFFIGVISVNSYCQINLVPNPSFEDTIMCPTGDGNIDNAVGWFSSRTSPDYYNSCANASAPFAGVPYNQAGHQYACNGNSYAGFCPYFESYIPVNYRECIGVGLSSPLTVGVEYFVSAYISRADTINPLVPADTVGCATNKFGFRFSTIQYSISNPVPIDNFSHIHTDSIVKDEIGWTQVKGSFIADSSYQYLMIGNFYDDFNTDTFQCADIAYYYLDMVCVSTDSAYCNNTIGIIENKEQQINIYPNPFVDYINIDFPLLTESYDIMIYNILGEEIIQNRKITTSTIQLEIADMPNSVLYVRIIYNNRSFYYKLLKQ